MLSGKQIDKHNIEQERAGVPCENFSAFHSKRDGSLGGEKPTHGK